ncbi:MAG: hypothetical protein H6726_20655 [Sandaracinaceae bacterium]|nr:hypothetical protein [Myxococcales bacterium]MCB9660073.1 hypothetical protein [Sandaracinaceae bacterium]
MKPFHVALALALLGSGCASLPSPVTATLDPTPVPRPIAGRVLYAARHATVTGASREQTLRPARRVGVDAVLPSGEVLVSGMTDDDGVFALRIPDSRAVLRVRAAIVADGFDLAVTRDPFGAQEHALDVPLPTDPEAQAIEISIGDESEMAGALHLLDTVLTGARAVHAWTGEYVPPFYAYWGRGVTTEWSYYRAERVAGSGRYSVELLGGEPGRQTTTDTDEHDEAIILHEFGHFVMDVMTTDSSHGGTHPGGVLIDPGLAWEEGRASWFACAVLRQPLYVDTIGIEPSGSLRVAANLETQSAEGPRGMGSEAGVEEILWDLSDGGPPDAPFTLPDTDNDGVALGPAAVFAAMRGIAREPGAYPDITSFLRYLVRTQVADGLAIKQLLLAGGHPEAMLPLDDTPLWPLDITLGATVGGKIDSITDPSPSGGPPRPGNGRDAVQAYRVHVPTAMWLTVRLTIFGSGGQSDRTDVDLELRDLRANPLGASRGEGPSEQIVQHVQPGWYVIYVRDGGSPNRAGYELSVTGR